MAAYFREMLGTMLISEPLTEDAVSFPSPLQLRGRIILKHRKIDFTDPANLEKVAVETTCEYLTSISINTSKPVFYVMQDADDNSETIKTGFLHVKDRISGSWRKVSLIAFRCLGP